MLNDKGEYDCGSGANEHWTIDSVADRMRAPLAYYDNHVIAESAEQRLLHAAKPVRSLYLVSDAPTAAEAMPLFIPQLTELCSLRLPSQIAPTLRPDMIGRHVKELAFYGTYDERYWNNKTVALPSDVVFTGIEALSGEALCYRVETRFRFAATLFPNLRFLGFTFDAKRQFAHTLRALPHLIAVNAAAFDSIENLADLLPCQELVSLTLSWNKNIETLRGIERFPNLRYLKLGSLTQLRTLDGINALRQLEFVGVYWSKRVEKADALLDLPALRTIDTFGIDPTQSAWLSLKKEAGVRGIDVRLIG
jgi:hypothetical protein